MPPKPNPAASLNEARNFNVSMTISRSFPQEANSSPRPIPSSGMRCRIFSVWAENCLTTPIFGDDNLPWAPNESKTECSVTVQYTFDAQLTAKEELLSFHQNPGIFFYFTTVSETAIDPVGVLHLDCSPMLLQSTELSMKRTIKDFEVSISIKNIEPIKPMEELISLEPVVINLECLNNFPIYENEEPMQSFEHLYIYSKIKMSGNTYRSFFAIPSTSGVKPTKEMVSTASSPRVNETKRGLVDKDLEDSFDAFGDEAEDGAKTLTNTLSSAAMLKDVDDREEKFPLSLKFVLLPGLFDLAYFREILTSQTFQIQIHQENFNQRCFTSSMMESYMKLLAEEPGGLSLIGAAPAAPAKKGSTANAAALAFIPTPTTATKSDLFLIESIQAILEQSSRIRCYGGGRFRLEQLLSKSNDLLWKFQQKRDSTSQSDLIVRETIVTPVQLEKPSHPEKWDLPADLSLKKALAAAKEREDRRKEAAASPIKPAWTSKRPPRHELFFKFHTNIVIKAKLLRSLDRTIQSHDSDLPMIATKTLQDPKMTIRPEDKDFNKTVRLNQDQLVNLSEEQVMSILAKTPFTRMIIRFPYQDDETLRAINDGISKINHDALPNIQGTIRSYSLEPKERDESIRGGLDLLSGVMVLDDDRRLVILEGLAKPFGGIHRFYSEYLPKIADNTADYAILCNPTILFADRLYPDYCPDLKRIRIRGKLAKLSKRPEIYNHQQVDMQCFEAIDLLMNLNRLQDLRSSKLYEIYPSQTALNQVELLYGEAITRADMDGTLKREFIETFRRKRRSRGSSRGHSRGGGSRPGTSESRATSSRATTPMSRSSRGSTRSSSGSPSSRGNTAAMGLTGVSPGDESEEEEDVKVYQRRAKKLPHTDCRNPQFERHLQNREIKDYLGEQQQLRRDAYLSLLFRREQQQEIVKRSLRKVFPQLSDEDIANGNIPPIYNYSTQTLNYKAKLMNALKDEIRESHNKVYTMSKDFISQTISVIDEDRFQKEENLRKANPSVELNLDKSHWLTQRGFQYPAPKTKKELLQHPKRPTETRIEDLKEPFYDATDVKKTASRDTLDEELLRRERNFQTQFHLDGFFGALAPPQFEQPECQLKYIGHNTVLPRGRLLNSTERNPEFFQSVFIGGEKQQQLMKEAAEAEKRLWESKIVVDDKSFKVGHLVVRDKPLPFQKVENILHDPPKRQVLKDLYEKRGFTTTPLTIFAEEPYTAATANSTIGRDEHPEKFITALYPPKGGTATSPKSLTKSGSKYHHGVSASKPLDFSRYLYKSDLKNDVFAKVAKRSHPALDRSNVKECSGPKWEVPSNL